MKHTIKPLFAKSLKTIALSLLIVIPTLTNAGSTTPHPEPITLINKPVKTNVWTEYKTFAGIKIEYRYQDCDSKGVGSFRNQTLVFFKFTNTTKQKLELAWETEIYFDDECLNCAKINSGEHTYTVKLDAKEVIEGDCSSFNDRALYIHSNFIKLVPGMTGRSLSDFKLINLRTSVWK